MLWILGLSGYFDMLTYGHNCFILWMIRKDVKFVFFKCWDNKCEHSDARFQGKGFWSIFECYISLDTGMFTHTSLQLASHPITISCNLFYQESRCTSMLPVHLVADPFIRVLLLTDSYWLLLTRVARPLNLTVVLKHGLVCCLILQLQPSSD